MLAAIHRVHMSAPTMAQVGALERLVARRTCKGENK